MKRAPAPSTTCIEGWGDGAIEYFWQDEMAAAWGLPQGDGMRLPCPHCGSRDIREFDYMGHALALERPAPDAGAQVWDDYVHNRDNPAGETRDLWYHGMGCGAWLVVHRNTVTHEIYGAALARDVKGAGQ